MVENSEKNNKDLEKDSLFYKKILSGEYKEIIEQIQKIKQTQKIDYDEIKKIIQTLEENENKNTIPLNCYKNEKLGILETTVKYLKENKKQSFQQIAKTLNRSYTTITNTYSQTIKKYQPEFLTETTEPQIDPTILSDRKKSPLFLLVAHLKENQKMRFSEIAKLLARDQRNIASTYNKQK